MIFDNFDRIVFAGDSVTDMGRARPVGEGFGEALGQSYVHIIENMLAAYYPEYTLRITNMGASGNTSRDLLNRWDSDVIALAPQWVSICIGINDVWRQFDLPSVPEAAVGLEEYEENLRKMITSVKDKVKGIILATPYFIEPNRNDRMRARMDEYCGVCKKLAEEYGCIFVDFQKMYENYCGVRYSATIAWDRVHPNLIGATLMARTLLEACGFDPLHKAY